MDNINFKNSRVIIEEVLKKTTIETTEIVYFSEKDGSRKGPYIRKTYTKGFDLGNTYKKLLRTNHKNLPKIYDVYQDSDKLIVILEYVEGSTLDKVNKPDFNIFNDVCEAVKYLHTNFSQPIIHRDIKPENVVVCKDGSAKLIDFGIARNFDKNKNKDTKHLGTVGYAPPEQFGFAQSDVRTDIYALGKVLEYISDNHNRIVKKACSLDPNNRYQSVEELQRALEGKNSVRFSNRPIVKYLGIIWNSVLTFLLIFMIISTLATLFGQDSEYTIEMGICFCISTIVFIYLPIYYILLFKRPLKFLPSLNIKKIVIILVISFFGVFIFSMLAYIL